MITIKKPEEIEIMKEGGKRHAFILKHLEKMVAPGIRVVDLENEARKLIEEGGDKGSFLGYTPEGVSKSYPSVLCISINDEIVHGIPNAKQENGEEKILKDGDIVSIDLGLTHKGLITDSAITVGVGNISEENRKLIEYAKEALALGIKVACGGAKVQDIGVAIESFAVKRGVNLCEGLAGHGVGYSVHEDPFVPNVPDPTQKDILKPGMVIAIEPMMTYGTSKIRAMPDEYTYKTKDGSIAVHCEHTIVITDGEAIILTK